MAGQNFDVKPVRNEQTVLVLGATGQQGGAVVRALNGNSGAVRALVRNPDHPTARKLAADGVDIFHGDFGDAESLRMALAGADGVFSIQPNSGEPDSGITDSDEVRFGKLIASLAVDAGVRHIVYSSASIISRGETGIPNLDCKREIEEHIRGLPIAFTIVRPATFMELLARRDFWSDGHLISFFADPDRRLELIAVDDIGRIAAAVLNDRDRFAGKSINLAGDELTATDIASAISQAMGRPISYQRFPDELLERQPVLARAVHLFETGAAAGNAEIAALNDTFGMLTSLKSWLAGSGRHLIQTALSGSGSMS